MSTTNPRQAGPLFTSFDKMRHEFERLLEAAWSRGERALDAVGLRPGEPWLPRVDLIETATEVRASIDLPGTDASQISVSLAGNMLTVQGERTPTPHGDDDVVHLHERGAGRFKRVVALPAAIDPERVSARYDAGVLHVTMPRTQPTMARQIHVAVSRPPQHTQTDDVPL